MIYTISDKFIFVVFGLIKSNYACNIKMFEHLKIILWSVASSLKFTYVVQGTHECDELIRYNPIQVTIFNFFVVLILFVVELSKFVPTQSDSVL